MGTEIEHIGPRKTVRWHELEDKDYVYRELEKRIDGDPRGIDWNELMLEHMPSTVCHTCQNIVKAYLKEQRELVHRQLDKEKKKPRRMSYRERQAHYKEFNF